MPNRPIPSTSDKPQEDPQDENVESGEKEDEESDEDEDEYEPEAHNDALNVDVPSTLDASNVSLQTQTPPVFEDPHLDTIASSSNTIASPGTTSLSTPNPLLTATTGQPPLIAPDAVGADFATGSGVSAAASTLTGSTLGPTTTKVAEVAEAVTGDTDANGTVTEMDVDNAGARNKEDAAGALNEEDEEGEENEEGEEDFVDGAPEDMPKYMEDIWECLVGASAAEDWERAMSLWGQLEKKLEYPEGRVSKYIRSRRMTLTTLIFRRENPLRSPR